MKGKRMRNSIFLAIWIPVTVIVLILGIAVNIVATGPVSEMLITMFTWERGLVEVVPVEGTENWDANYYTYKAKNLQEATQNSNNVVEEISNEGFVLLKNNLRQGSSDKKVLPLSTESDGITMLGRRSVDPIVGGSGSGNIDESAVIKPYAALTEEGFDVDETSYNYFNANYYNYPNAKITMDKYKESAFFIGEIPTDDYSFTPVGTDTAVVFIGRGGGEGWDLSRDLVTDAATNMANKIMNDGLSGEEKKSYNANTDFAKLAENATKEKNNYVAGQHQLELSKEEKDMIKYANDNYANTVVVINSSNAMELGDIAADTGDYAADAIVWIGSTGGYGMKALANILSGAVNPSGRLADIYASDFTADPTFKNEGVYKYSDVTEADVVKGDNTDDVGAYAMQYEEGIYVGYKYYETAAVEAAARNYEGFNYDQAVVYPFGYGLSYTNFTQNITNYSTDGDEITVTVSVKNNTALAGKEVVQLYYTPPYTKNGIEKAAVNLIDFAKVDVAGNGDANVTFTIPKEDLASYDYKNHKSYVLEDGTYEISLRTDSHTLATGATNKFTFTVNSDIVYSGDNKRESDNVAATNRFDDVSSMMKDTATEGYARNFSRANFKDTFPTTPVAADLVAGNIQLSTQQNGGTTVKAGLAKFNVETDPTLGNVATSKVYSANQPTLGASNGTKFSDMRGIAYTDPAWDTLLANIKADELVNGTFNQSAFNTAAIESIGKAKTNDPDGPAGISALGAKTGCAGFMSEVVLASTFNTALAEKMGDALAEEAYYYTKGEETTVGGKNGWYAPAMNTHRSPFAGRNFEYYSEDPILSGYMGAATVRGASAKGVYCYIKHFALNDSEIYRTANLCVWANEQTMRELYFKPFEITIKNSEIEIKYIADENGRLATKKMQGATAVMSSFNRIGTTWAGGSYALMTEVLRNEWGFEGVASSDFNLYDYMDPDQGMRAGTDMQLSFPMAKSFSDTTSATARTAMIKSIHNMCYTTVNSNVTQGVVPGSTFIYHLAGWQVGFLVLAIFLYIATACGIAWILVRMLLLNKIAKQKAAAAAAIDSADVTANATDKTDDNK